MPSEQEPDLTLMLETAPVGILRCEASGTIVYLNAFAADEVGLRKGDDLGRYIVLPPGSERLTDLVAGDVQSKRQLQGFAIRHSDGFDIGFSADLCRLVDGSGRFDAVIYRTAGRRDRNAAEISRDPLTGLLDREACFIELRRRLAATDGRHVAVMFLDLDKFKEVNDTYGHKAGDQLLMTIARQLSGAVRAGDVVGRLGGDEFLVIADAGTNGDPTVPIALAHRLDKATRRPVPVGQVVLHTQASIGVAIGNPPKWTADLLVETADLAMYEAKSAAVGGRPRVSIASPGTGAGFTRRRTIKVDFAKAWETGQLYFDYQPIRRLSDLEVLGAEAFLRWHHPELGNVEPREFLPVASSPDHLRAFTDWILKTATKEWAQLRRASPFFADKGLSVNIDPVQLLAEGYLDSHMAILETSGLRLCDVILEVQDWDRCADRNMADVLAVLANAGIPVALDFFGVGYNTLDFVKSIPVAGYKIDGEFTRSLTGPDRSAAAVIIGGVRDIADGLGHMTLAEGLQTAEQVKRCTELGIYCGQGVALGGAVRIDVFDERERRVRDELARSATLETLNHCLAASRAPGAAWRAEHPSSFR